MGRLKVPRKSTNVDMTAMCDVAFLLLTFFILVGQFKPAEALTVATPKSVSTTPTEAKDLVMVVMDQEGKVFFTVSDDANDEKRDIIEYVNENKSLNLTDAEKMAFMRGGSFVGVPFSQLKSYLQQKPEDLQQANLPGIPVDSANNELTTWMRGAKTAFQGSKMNLVVKGDSEAKYLAFKGVINAFKAVDELKFQLITDPEGVPPGTELFQKQMSGATAAN